jgi:hypothetical protein
MSKAICIKCGAEMEYEGFECPIMCCECHKNWLKSFAVGTGVYAITEEIEPIYSTKCIVCGEFTDIPHFEAKNNVAKVCDKCKQAVMKMREEHEDKGK